MKTSLIRRASRIVGACSQAILRRHRLQAGSYLVLIAAALAQPNRPPPHLAFVYPAGGQRGTTFTVSLGGQNLADASAVYFSGVGVTAKIASYDRPLTQKETNDLREKIQQLQERRAAALGLPAPAPAVAAKPKSTAAAVPSAGAAKPAEFTAADEKQLADLRAQLATRVNRQVSPALAETVTLEVTLAPDAATGERELRVRTPIGLSNPFVFCVGQLPEFTRPAITATNFPAPRPFAQPDPRERRLPPNEMTLTLPAIANGQILPSEVNRLRFAAKKGQRIVALVSARALIPYLADAVPGWFQPTLAIRDARGGELAYQDDFRFNPDPALVVEIPADGIYLAEIKDAIYRGREDFVYRVALGELPFVTGVFPLGCPPDSATTFELSGANLPVRTAAPTMAGQSEGVFTFAVRAGTLTSNPVRVAVDATPTFREAEPNDRIENAQPLALPAIVDGRIQRVDDVDVFRFEGQAGAKIVVEIIARRLGSPLDSTLTLTDASGRQLAFNDDSGDKAAALLTHQADSRISTTLPANGAFFIRVADAQHQGGAEFSYRLRVTAPRPDFELRVTPATLNLHAGGATPITVYALRRDGFSGEISLALRNAPRGLALNGARIPANQDKLQLTISAAPLMPEGPFALEFVGRAIVDGQSVMHSATPAEDMMQAFAYHHLVPAQELAAIVSGRGAPFRVLTPMPVKISASDPTRIRIAVPTTAGRNIGHVQFELTGALDGFDATSSPATDNVIDVVVTCDGAKIKPGTQGNFVLQASGERTAPNTPGAANRTQRIALGVVPAIPFEVVAPAAPPAR